MISFVFHSSSEYGFYFHFSVFLHGVLKTDAARITKRAIETFQDESLNP